MEKLLNMLKTIPEYELLLKAVESNQAAAVTGVGQINRSHLIAGLYTHTQHRPVVVICQDDMAAKRLQEELKAFLQQEVPVLPSRDLTLYDSAVVSRGWEQKRLRQLYDLQRGQTPIQIFSWESLSQRTMPPGVLKAAAFRLETGKSYILDDLRTRLTASGTAAAAW